MSQQSFIISDGSNDVAVLNSSPSGTEYGIGVRIIGSTAGGTSSSFTQPFPGSGTAAGFYDGTNMQGARVFDLDSGGGTEYVLGTNLRFTSSGGSVEAGTASNPIRIDPTGTTIQPISGTVTANAGTGTFTISGTVTANQGGTWTVQPGNTQNTTPWLTQDSADGPVSPGVVASKSILFGGQYNTSLPTLTNTQQAAVQVDSNGRLLVGSIASALPTGANVIGAVTQSAGPWTQNITQFGSNNVVTGTGASGVGIPRVTVANDSNILATQSGTWTVAQGAAAILSGAWPVKVTDGTNTLPTMDAAGRAGFQKITDGTNTAAVKAASTAPLATDQALVVTMSPNSAGSDKVGQYNSTLPTLTNGSITYLQTDSSGRLITAPVGTNAAISGFALGTMITTATTNIPVRASTYVEQTTNAQRSFKSASANDASAGTGARTIIITYYDQTGAGPSTETVTLNGTTAVNTVSATICFIESIVVASVGSTGSNVGIISMFTTTGGGGTTMATINATDNQTFWAHHYTPTGKTTYITGIAGNNNHATNATVMAIKAKSLVTATAPELVVSDYVRCGGGSGNPDRLYSTPIKVVGPARVLVYGAPEGTSSITSRVSFDFYDQ